LYGKGVSVNESGRRLAFGCEHWPVATDDLQAVANLFALLAEIDFRGASPLYERLARDSAEDPELLALVLPAAPRDRLPHLLFAAVQ
jgi:hypothetical protein